MSKHTSGTFLSIFALDANNGAPLYRQIYSAIREAILTGSLKLGTRLPSTRTLSQELEVSRNTVLVAFEQLHAEGFLDCRTGSGSFVVQELPHSHFPAGIPKDTETARPDNPSAVALCRRGRAMMEARTPATPSGAPCAFTPGIPALDSFPHQHWNRCVSRAGRHLDQAALNYGPSEGYLPLREALASYLAAARGVRCEPGQIMLVSGVQQGLDLITRLLTEPGDAVWMEDPGHLGARGAFIAGQTRLIPVPVDTEGIVVDDAIRQCPAARLAYVTPSHQSPTGAVMSLRRRIRLLDWARRNEAWIIEDDYDSEFRYKGRPLTALQGLAEDARVLYLGTFSKVLAPGLRLAYLVVPAALVDIFSAGRRLLDTHSPVPVQIAMTEFIERGYFTAHIRHMRRLYQERQAILIEEASRRLGDWLHLSPAPAGMHLVGHLRQGNDKTLSGFAARGGIVVPPLSRYYLGAAEKTGLLFGYACVPPEEITAAVGRLEAIFRESLAPGLAPVASRHRGAGM